MTFVVFPLRKRYKGVKATISGFGVRMMRKYTLENAEGAIKDGQSRELNYIVHIWTLASVISHHKH
jgi:hypothetical protein